MKKILFISLFLLNILYSQNIIVVDTVNGERKYPKLGNYETDGVITTLPTKSIIEKVFSWTDTLTTRTINIVDFLADTISGTSITASLFDTLESHWRAAILVTGTDAEVSFINGFTVPDKHVILQNVPWTTGWVAQNKTNLYIRRKSGATGTVTFYITIGGW